jgi:Mg2+/Co2+ transporter CorB
LEQLPIWAQLLALLVLMLLSAFFSISETSMMALNRYRLAHLVRKGRRSARLAAELLARTDRLLSSVLIGNNVVNVALTAIATALAIRYLGNNDTALLIATAATAVVIILFCEITPKVIGARFPEQVALPASYPLTLLTRLLHPFVWVINELVSRSLKLLGIRLEADEEASALSPEELRSVVLESGSFLPQKHRSILLNFFDLENITVDDVMVPRQRIEALDLAASEAAWRDQLTTCFHNKLPVYEGEINRVVGILHVRRGLSLLQRETITADDLRAELAEPYFVPSGTPVFRQLQFFQENRRRFALVVDEYGELQGLLTLADIVEELVGEFTSSSPSRDAGLRWNERGEVQVEGSVALRDLNRQLGTAFPVDGPRTLNGLILETLRELPEADVGLRFDDIGVVVTHIEDRTIRSARLQRLDLAPARSAGSTADDD